jgi:hypothetical protein
MWGHVALSHTPCAHTWRLVTPLAHTWCLGYAYGWAIPAHTWCLDSACGLGTPQRTRGAWALPQVWALPTAHVALELCLWVGYSPAHTWRLGDIGLGTSGAWVMAKYSKEMSLASRPKINGSSIRTQFYWVLYHDSMFMGPKILIIINSLRNIIIFL